MLVPDELCERHFPCFYGLEVLPIPNVGSETRILWSCQQTGAAFREHSGTPWLDAGRNGSVSADYSFKTLMQETCRGSDVNPSGNSALHRSALTGSLDALPMQAMSLLTRLC